MGTREDELLEKISQLERKVRLLESELKNDAEKYRKEALERKTRDLSLLLEISLETLETGDKRQVLKKILEGANRLVGLDTGAVYSVSGKTLFLISTIPPLPDAFPDEFRKAEVINHPHIGKALAAGIPVVTPDINNEELTKEESIIIGARQMRTLLYIPLIANGESYGIIILGTIGRLHNFDEYDISLCRTLSSIATLALENSILISDLRKAREKAEEGDRLKTAFLHNISHEIRTPLNAIIGFSAFLSNPCISEAERNKFIGIINKSNNQLLQIISDIINISHIEAGQVAINESPTNPVNLLEKLSAQFRPEAESKCLVLKFDFEPANERKFTFFTDEVKLTEAMANLLSNAIKFTETGTVTFGFTRERSGLTFYVEDTGIGISEYEQQKIFERFYQVDKNFTRAYPGAGLGLSICDAYIKLLGGSIKVDSAPGKGSRFSFTLPLKHAVSEHLQTDKPETGKSSEKKQGRKILIAEDELSNFQLLEYMLKSTRAEIIHAKNGKIALDICSSDQNIDLILMDVRMPVMDGLKSAEEISKIRPGIPIIAQTAFADFNDREKAFKAGCCDFLAKPYSKAQLISTVEKYLGE